MNIRNLLLSVLINLFVISIYSANYIYKKNIPNDTIKKIIDSATNIKVVLLSISKEEFTIEQKIHENDFLKDFINSPPDSKIANKLDNCWNINIKTGKNIKLCADSVEIQTLKINYLQGYVYNSKVEKLNSLDFYFHASHEYGNSELINIITGDRLKYYGGFVISPSGKYFCTYNAQLESYSHYLELYFYNDGKFIRLFESKELGGDKAFFIDNQTLFLKCYNPFRSIVKYIKVTFSKDQSKD